MAKPIVIRSSSDSSASSRKEDYYSAGNTEIATETPLTRLRNAYRDKLTRNAERLVIVLVGLPARGKSFVARKMDHYLNWSGVQCKIFNVGRYRREAYASQQRQEQQQQMQIQIQMEMEQQQQQQMSGVRNKQEGACDADFFSATNAAANNLRERVAEMALTDMLRWLDYDDEDDAFDEDAINAGGGSSVSLVPEVSRHSSASSVTSKLDYRRYDRVAIFDATNSTDRRRRWILEQCTAPEKRQGKATGVVFVESICDDQELLDENYRYKVSSSPDFNGMTEAEAIADLKNRVRNYEEQYETIADDNLSYIKVFNLSTKLLVNHIYGRMAKELVPALMGWHIGTRPVFLCRPGQTFSGILTDSDDFVARENRLEFTDPRLLDMSTRSKRRGVRGDSLGPSGCKFREELLEFCYYEVHAFMNRRASIHDGIHTGTSISGLATAQGGSYVEASAISTRGNSNIIPDHGTMVAASGSDGGGDGHHGFPLRIMTSTMPRAAETVYWPEYEFSVNQLSNLNPLDKGDYAGMELDEMKKVNPTWYEKLERNPYGTRFPGGESYQDLIHRLNSVVIDLEQQVIPTLVVSHVSILQCLMAYFRNSPVEQCMSMEVPLHTVIKYTPVRGGGWVESQHPLIPPAASSSCGSCEELPDLNNSTSSNNNITITSNNNNNNNNNNNSSPSANAVVVENVPSRIWDPVNRGSKSRLSASSITS